MLQPCIVAAYEEMCRHAGLSGDAARRQVGATGYLDDVTLIQHPEVVVAGLRVFRHEARARGWEVSMDKTVVGCGYYMQAGERADYVQRVRTVFGGVLTRRTLPPTPRCRRPADRMPTRVVMKVSVSRSRLDYHGVAAEPWGGT